MSVSNEALLEAHHRGYRVTQDGAFLNPSGKQAGYLMKDGYMHSTGFIAPGHHYKVHFRVHRLAAFQWFGNAIFRPGVEVRHLNGDRLDNSRGNIALGSHSDNMLDRPKEERRAHARHAASFCRALTSEQAQQLILDRQAGATYKKLMQKYGIAKSTVSYIVNGKMYSELIR